MDNKILIGIGAIVLVVVIIFLAFFGLYNSFVSLEQGVDAKWANVETQYQRRVDLIPNVVNTVKGVSGFEQETLTQLSELRTQWQTQPQARIETANQIESALSKLLVVAENYPELKATQAYRDLIVELEGTENRIAFARTEFNDAVRNYNTSIKSFPGVIVAGMFGFSEKEFFEATLGAENPPIVDFS